MNAQAALAVAYILGSMQPKDQVPSKQSLSIHGRFLHNGSMGPRPTHKPIVSEFNPNSQTQRRKRNQVNHPVPNRPGFSKASTRAKRIARRQAN
jgi:hypothetical protein